MKIRDLPIDVAPYVHPVYRSLIIKRKGRKLKVKRTLVNRIKQKLFYRQSLPRVAIFYCEVCTLNSRFLEVVRNHECSMVNESRHIVSFENEVRIAQMGFKSKAKDSWAVMERLPNPQHVSLVVKVKSQEADKKDVLLKNPMSLRDLCLMNIHLAKEEVVDFDKWQQDYVKPRAEDYHRRMENMSMVELSRRRGETAWKCNICRKFFASFADHDDHLVDSDCMNRGLVQPIRVDPFDPTVSYPIFWKPKKNEWFKTT